MTNNIPQELYKGLPSSMCTGCGHDIITLSLTKAVEQLNLNPKNIVKLSGIGCSSKTPAYFLSGSFGFNSLHGRMAPLALGVHSTNPELKIIGLSGDGDTANIGLGGFIHLMQKNLPMLYIVANNGVYGLTKGQFSATADTETQNKHGNKPKQKEIDLCEQALLSGVSFVARASAGDRKGLLNIITEALKVEDGLAFIDIISPCVAYGNNDESTKSYNHLKNNILVAQEIDPKDPDEKNNIQTFKIDPSKSPMEALQKIHNAKIIGDNKGKTALGVFYHKKTGGALKKNNKSLVTPNFDNLRTPQADFDLIQKYYSIHE